MVLKREFLNLTIFLFLLLNLSPCAQGKKIRRKHSHPKDVNFHDTGVKDETLLDHSSEDYIEYPEEIVNLIPTIKDERNINVQNRKLPEETILHRINNNNDTVGGRGKGTGPQWESILHTLRKVKNRDNSNTPAIKSDLIQVMLNGLTGLLGDSKKGLFIPLINLLKQLIFSFLQNFSPMLFDTFKGLFEKGTEIFKIVVIVFRYVVNLFKKFLPNIENIFQDVLKKIPEIIQDPSKLVPRVNEILEDTQIIPALFKVIKIFTQPIGIILKEIFKNILKNIPEALENFLDITLGTFCRISTTLKPLWDNFIRYLKNVIFAPILIPLRTLFWPLKLICQHLLPKIYF